MSGSDGMLSNAQAAWDAKRITDLETALGQALNWLSSFPPRILSEFHPQGNLSQKHMHEIWRGEVQIAPAGRKEPLVALEQALNFVALGPNEKSLEALLAMWRLLRSSIESRLRSSDGEMIRDRVVAFLHERMDFAFNECKATTEKGNEAALIWPAYQQAIRDVEEFVRKLESTP